MGPMGFQFQAKTLGVGYLSSAVYKSLPLPYQHKLKEEFMRLYPEAMKFLENIGTNAFTAPIYIIGTVFMAHKLFGLAKKWFNFLRGKKEEIQQVIQQQQQQQEIPIESPNIQG